MANEFDGKAPAEKSADQTKTGPDATHQAGFGAKPGSENDPTKVPAVNEGLTISGGGATGSDPKSESAAKGEPTPGLSFDGPKPDTPVVPHATPETGSVPTGSQGKDQSGNAHRIDTITVHGWVDLPVEVSPGVFDNRHTYGPVQIPNARMAHQAAVDEADAESGQSSADRSAHANVKVMPAPAAPAKSK